MLDLVETADGTDVPIQEARVALSRQTAHDLEVSCEPPRLKILVVEDDAGDYSLIERCLQHMSRYEPQIVLAGNLAAARFAVSADDFDLVLLDYGMDGECGIELLVDLARINRGCPCILLSGCLTSDMEMEAVVMGAAACLAKGDLSEKSLEAVVDQVLRGQAVQRTQQVLKRASLKAQRSNPAELGVLARKPPLSAGTAGYGQVPPVPGDMIFDLQDVVIEAVTRARREPTRADGGRLAVSFRLQECPIYVRGNRQVVLKQIEQALRCVESDSVNVKVEETGLWSEIGIEPVSTKTDDGPSCNDDNGGVMIMSRDTNRISILLPAAECPRRRG